MSSSSSNCLAAYKNAIKNEKRTSNVLIGDILCGNTACYQITDFIGEGAFGKVATAVNIKTLHQVALKIITTDELAVREIKMLKEASVLDPVKKNVIHLFETFEHQGQTCFVFERLDMDLCDLVNKQWRPLSLNEIRPIAYQLLTTFAALKSIGIIHYDLKPDNVMLINHQDQPFRVKLIDFGLAFNVSETPYLPDQPLGYRAPELFLGLPISEAIDMWGLGCVLGCLYIGNNMFNTDYEYQSMKDIFEMLGQPEDHVLSAGEFTDTFFKMKTHTDNPTWQMKTPEEYQVSTGSVPFRHQCSYRLRSLDDLIKYGLESLEWIELEDLRVFVSLLKGLLNTDPDKRITPQKALQHPFVTMAHMKDKFGSSTYIQDSVEKMGMVVDDWFPREEGPSQEPSAVPPADGRHPNNFGLPVPRCCWGSESMANSFDREEATTGIDAFVSGVKDNLYKEHYADGEPEEQHRDKKPPTTPEEQLADSGSSDEVLPASINNSRLGRVRKFFQRAMKAMVGSLRKCRGFSECWP